MTNKDALYILKSMKKESVNSSRTDALDMAIEALQKQKTGKWIIEIEEEHTEKYDARIPHWFCSCCRTEYDPHSATLVNYCSNCGAKMEGEENDN